jgi:hypothetical protein
MQRKTGRGEDLQQSHPGSGRYVPAGYWPSPDLHVWRVEPRLRDGECAGMTCVVSTAGIDNPRKRRALYLWPSQRVDRRCAETPAHERMAVAA